MENIISSMYKTRHIVAAQLFAPPIPLHVRGLREYNSGQQRSVYQILHGYLVADCVVLDPSC